MSHGRRAADGPATEGGYGKSNGQRTRMVDNSGSMPYVALWKKEAQRRGIDQLSKLPLDNQARVWYNVSRYQTSYIIQDSLRGVSSQR